MPLITHIASLPDKLTGQLQQEVVTTVKQQPPVAKFTLSPTNTGEVPFTVTLNAEDSIDPNGNIVSYQWSSSDGQTASGQPATMTFTQLGAYTITLTVTDNDNLVVMQSG